MYLYAILLSLSLIAKPQANASHAIASLIDFFMCPPACLHNISPPLPSPLRLCVCAYVTQISKNASFGGIQFTHALVSIQLHCLSAYIYIYYIYLMLTCTPALIFIPVSPYIHTQTQTHTITHKAPRKNGFASILCGRHPGSPQAGDYAASPPAITHCQIVRTSLFGQDHDLPRPDPRWRALPAPIEGRVSSAYVCV